MTNRDKSSGTSGITILDLLLILFITLKLVGVITWSWWWILSPIWIPIFIIGALILGVSIYKVFVLKKK